MPDKPPVFGAGSTACMADGSVLTPDLGGSATNGQLGDAVCDHLCCRLQAN